MLVFWSQYQQTGQRSVHSTERVMKPKIIKGRTLKSVGVGEIGVLERL